jgi:hypothetical protein
MHATSTRAAFSCWLVRPTLTVLGVGVCVALGAVPDPPTLPFDNQTNGFEDQAAFDQDREAFDETETILKEKVCQGAEEAAAARGTSSKAQADHGTEPACVEERTEGV